MTDPSDQEEDVLADLAAALAPQQPTPEMREQLLGTVRGRGRFAPFAQEIAERCATPLDKVLAALEHIDDESAWLRLPDPAPRILPVHERVVISRLPPGTGIPRHGHETREITFVLEGSLHSDDGHEYSRGDCIEMAQGTEHELRVGADHDCLVVLALPPDNRG